MEKKKPDLCDKWQIKTIYYISNLKTFKIYKSNLVLWPLRSLFQITDAIPFKIIEL